MLLRLQPPSAPARGRLYYCVMCFWASTIRRFVPAIFTLVLALPALRAPFAQSQTPRIADFEDVAQKAGLTMLNVFGGIDTKKYIIETTGTGVAIFDYDNDGWPDIFILNGTTLEGSPKGTPPTSHLYRNNHDETFTDVTAQAGLVATGWAQGVCAGDYDNDGFEDLYVTYYGKNRLYHNQKGVFSEVGSDSGTSGTGKAWSTGCAFVDYDRDGLLDL